MNTIYNSLIKYGFFTNVKFLEILTEGYLRPHVKLRDKTGDTKLIFKYLFDKHSNIIKPNINWIKSNCKLIIEEDTIVQNLQFEIINSEIMQSGFYFLILENNIKNLYLFE